MADNINKEAVTNEENNNKEKYFTGYNSVQSKGKIDMEDFKDPYSIQKFVFLDKIAGLKESQKVLYYLLNAIVVVYFELLTLWYHLEAGQKLKKLFKKVINLSFNCISQLENHLPSGNQLVFKEELSLHKKEVHKKILKEDEVNLVLLFKYDSTIHPFKCFIQYLCCMVRVAMIIGSELMVLLVDYIFKLIKNSTNYKSTDIDNEVDNEADSE